MPLCLYMYGTFLLFLLPRPAQLSCHSGGPISRPSFLRVHASVAGVVTHVTAPGELQ